LEGSDDFFERDGGRVDGWRTVILQFEEVVADELTVLGGGHWFEAH
jgi:hypothetical protein